MSSFLKSVPDQLCGVRLKNRTMKKILNIITSPRGNASYSNQLGNAVIEKIKTEFPGTQLISRDLTKFPFPQLNEAHIEAFLTPIENHTTLQKQATSVEN